MARPAPKSTRCGYVVYAVQVLELSVKQEHGCRSWACLGIGDSLEELKQGWHSGPFGLPGLF